MLDWITVIGLIALGIIFLVAELIFIPGTTVVGVAGLVCIGVGIWFGYSNFGNETGTYILSGTVIISGVTLFYSLKSGAWKKFSLKTTINSKVNEGQDSLLIGDVGETNSALRPYGSVTFDNKVWEVQSLSGLIDAGKQVKIVQIKGRKILVTEVENETEFAA